MIVGGLHLLPARAAARRARSCEHATAREEPRLRPGDGAGLVLFVLSFFSLANSAYNPFIYFRF